MDSLVFIIVHHSNSSFHTELLNLCIQSIRNFYNNKIIVCKTSNSPIPNNILFNVEYVNTILDGSHIYGGLATIIDRNDIENYILIHDSMLLCKELPENILTKRFYYLWHFQCAPFDNKIEVLELINRNNMLSNNDKIKIIDDYENNFIKKWNGLFGPAFGGKFDVLKNLYNKLDLSKNNLINYIGRDQIMAGERYIALIANYLDIIDSFDNLYSLNGSIENHLFAFQKIGSLNEICNLYNYIFINKMQYFVKVWLGRS